MKQHSTPALSVIVPIAGNDKSRRVSSLEGFRSISSQTFINYELVVVEQSLDGHIYWSDYITNKTSGEHRAVRGPKFCAAWLRNVGSRIAKGDILLFMDADMVFDEHYFQYIMDHFRLEMRYCAGYSEMVFLGPASSNAFLLNHDVSQLEHARGSKIPFGVGFGFFTAGGINIFDRNWFLNSLGGYNENFLEWGCEDRELMARAVSLCKDDSPKTFDYKVFHFFHKRTQASRRQTTDKLHEYSLLHADEVSSELVSAGLGNLNGRTQVDYLRK